MRLSCILLATCAAVLSACSSATMGQKECSALDWRTMGYEDGIAGYSGAQIGVHRRACAKYGITPDLEAYQRGRAEGLREFCQPYNGYRAGVTGMPYEDVCPADLAADFLARYQAGQELYVREQRIRDVDAQLRVKRAEIARLEDAVARSGLRAVQEPRTLDQRVQAVLDVKQYGERIGRLKVDVAQLERDRVLYVQELGAYRATVASTR